MKSIALPPSDPGRGRGWTARPSPFHRPCGSRFILVPFRWLAPPANFPPPYQSSLPLHAASQLTLNYLKNGCRLNLVSKGVNGSPDPKLDVGTNEHGPWLAMRIGVWDRVPLGLPPDQPQEWLLKFMNPDGSLFHQKPPTPPPH